MIDFSNEGVWNMVQWMRIALLVGILGLAVVLPAEPLAGSFSDELDADLYDCTLVLHPAAQLAENNAVNLTLEAGQKKDALHLTITKRLDIEATVNGHVTHLAPVGSLVQPGTAYHLIVMRRGNWLGLLHDQTFLFRGEVPRASGNQAVETAGSGWTVDDPHIQRLEPVRFADDFMRKADEPGAWSMQRGQWALQSAWDNDPKGNNDRFANAAFSQNPFAWAGRNPQGSALCTVGRPYWEDYTVTTALQPGADGAAGLMVNMPDATNGYLVRWSPANDHGAQGDRLALLRVDDGNTTVIAENRGGYIPGLWYKLTVVSTLDDLQVLVDGRPRLAIKNPWPCRGGIGLYTEGANGAIFNDVVVNGRRVKTEQIAENQLARVKQRFQDDPNGMQSWAMRQDWLRFSETVPDQLKFRSDVFGDHWVTLTVRPLTAKPVNCGWC